MDRVLYVSSVAATGGAELSLIELVSHLDRAHFVPHLLVAGEGPLAQRFREIGVEVEFGSFPFFSRRRPWRYLQAVWRVARLIRRGGFSLLHVNCDRAIPHSVLAGRLTGVPILCHIHDMVRAWFLPHYVKHINRCSRIVANSQATARHCASAGMDPDILQVIYECCVTELFSSTDKDRSGLRSEWEIPHDAIAIGLVGHILRHKGHEDFIKAGAIITETAPSARLVVIGDDSMSKDRQFLPSLRELAQSLGIAGRCRFVGFHTDIPRVMAALDIVAVPSWEEPFGRVVVEALAAERPVVATASGGIPEIVEDGQTGLLVPPKDPKALADATVRLCQDPRLRREMGNRGPQSAQRFDVQPHARLFERTYRALLDGQAETLPRVPFGRPTWMGPQ